MFIGYMQGGSFRMVNFFPPTSLFSTCAMARDRLRGHKGHDRPGDGCSDIVVGMGSIIRGMIGQEMVARILSWGWGQGA